MYAFLLVADDNVGVVSSRPYPYRPFGVKRCAPGEAPFEDKHDDAEPRFSPRHVNAFYRNTVGYRNQGLPTRPNLYRVQPPWGLPPPSPAERAEHQLRNSAVAKNLKRNDWVYENAVGAAILCTIAIALIVFVAFPIVLVGIFRFSMKFFDSDSDIAFFLVLHSFFPATFFLLLLLGVPLFCGLPCVLFLATMETADEVYRYFVDNWRLGMERSKKTKVGEADERRWSGEMIVAP